MPSRNPWNYRLLRLRRRACRIWQETFPRSARGVVTYLSLLGVLGGGLLYYTHTRPERDEAQASTPATSLEFLQTAFQVNEAQTDSLVPVVLNGPASTDVRFEYSVIGGTATSPEDYELGSGGTQLIPRGERGVGIPLSLVDDKIAEGNETIQIELSNVEGVSLGAQTIVEITIRDSRNLTTDSNFGLQQNVTTLPVIDNPTPNTLPDFAKSPVTALPDLALSTPSLLTVTDGLQLRLEANALAGANSDPVSLWSDTSAAQNNATQAIASQQPLLIENALNNQKVVRFDGVDDYLVFDPNLLPVADAGRSVVVVSQANNDIPLFSYGQDNPGERYELRAGSSETGVGVNGHLYGANYAETDYAITSAVYPTGGNSASFVFGKNGSELVGTNLAGNPRSVDTVPQEGNVGTNLGTTSYFDGDIAEILIYDRELSLLERQEIECYLSTKYAITVAGCGNPLALHLDANSLTGNDGDGVTTWNDISGNGYAFEEAGAGPVLRTSALNGHNTVDFNNSFLVETDAEVFKRSENTTFVVAQSGQRNQEFVYTYVPTGTSGNVAGSGLEMAGSQNIKYNEQSSTRVSQNEAHEENFSLITTHRDELNASLYIHGRLAGTDTETSPEVFTQNHDIRLGAYTNISTARFHGEIAEMIVYDRVLSDPEREEVECYLALKYDLVRDGCRTALQLHLDADSLSLADGASVGTWPDQTANGLDAVQGTGANQPVLVHNALNGRKAVRFDGTDDFLEMPEFFNDHNATLIAVMQTNATGAWAFSDRGQASGNIAGLYYTGGSAGLLQGYLSDVNNSSILGPQTYNPGTDYAIAGLIGNGQTATAYLNNYKAEQTSSNFSFDFFTSYTETAAAPTLGRSFANNAYLNGDIAEFIYYDRPLSEEEYKEVRCYLADKYGLEVNTCGPSLLLNLDANNLGGSTGDAVGSWGDTSGNSRDAAQTDAAKQPQLVTGALNSQNVVRFDGTDDFLELPEFLNNQEATIYLVGVKQDNAGYIFVDGDGTEGYTLIRTINNGLYPYQQNGFSGSPNRAVVGPSLADGENFIGVVNYNPNTLEVNVNGRSASSVSGSGFSFPDQAPLLGGTVNGPVDEMFGGDLAQVLVFDGSLTESEKNSVECYLSQRYGIDNDACFQDSVEYYLDARQVSEQLLGQGVETWTDLSQNGNDFSQTNAADQPVLANENGIPYLNYEGTDFFENPAGVLNTPTDATVIQTVRPGNLGTNNTTFYNFGTTTSGRYQTSLSNSRLTYGGTSSSFSSFAVGDFSAKNLLYTHILENNSLSGSQFYFNGNNYPSGNTSSLGGAKPTVRLGSSPATERFYNSLVLTQAVDEQTREFLSVILAASAGFDPYRNYKYAATHPLVTGDVVGLNPRPDQVAQVELTNPEAGQEVFVGFGTETVDTSTAELSGGVAQRWNNLFALDKTGSTNVTLRFDFAKYLGGVPSGSNYELLYRPYSTGDLTPVTLAGASINGSVLEFDVLAANLADGYYTVGTTNASLSPLAPAQLPDAIGNLNAAFTGNYGEATLTFSPPSTNGSTIVDYLLEYSHNNFATSYLYNDGVSTQSSYTLDTLLYGPNYQFRVRPVLANGALGSPSNVATLEFAPRINSLTPDQGAPEGGYPAEISVDNFQIDAKIPLTITNMGGEVSDQQVEFTFDPTVFTSAVPNQECSNFYVESSAGVSLPLWIDGCATTRASGWFKVSSLPVGQSSYNLTLRNMVNPLFGVDQTFVFGDDFEGQDFDASKWENSGFTLEDGQAKSNNSNHSLRSVAAFDQGYELITKHETRSAPNNGYHPAGFYASSSNAFGFLYHGGTGYLRRTSTWVNLGAVVPSGPVVYRVRGIGSQAQVTIENAADGVITYDSGLQASSINQEKVSFGRRYDDSNYNQTQDVVWDWAVVTKYNADITVQVGALQNGGEISFDGTVVQIQSGESSNTVQATVPASSTGPTGLGSVDVVATNADTQTNTFTNGFTYVGPVITSLQPASGPSGGGQVITLRGEHLSTGLMASSVEFGNGNPAAALRYLSPGEIEITTPASSLSNDGTGAVSVTLTTPTGNTATTTYTYVNPQITSVSPNQGAVEGGYDITITGEGFAGGGVRQNLTLNNTSGGAITNAEVDLVLDTATLITEGNLDVNCTNISVEADGVALDYWLDGGCNTANTVLWVRVPNLTGGLTPLTLAFQPQAVTSQSDIGAFSFSALERNTNIAWFRGNEGVVLDGNGRVQSWVNGVDANHILNATEAAGAALNIQSRDSKNTIGMSDTAFNGPVLQTGTEFTSFMVHRLNVTPFPEVGIFYNGNGGADGAGYRMFGNQYAWVYGGRNFHQYGPASTLDWTQVGTRRSGTTSSFYHNTNLRATVGTSYGNPQTDTFAFGQGDHEVAELILFNEGLGESERLAVENYLNLKYNLTSQAEEVEVSLEAPGTFTKVAFGTRLVNNYTRDLTVNNPTGTAITDAEILVELDTQTLIVQDKLDATCANLEFELGGSVLDFYLESGCATSQTLVWLRLPSLPSGDTVVTLTYGAGLAPTKSSDIANFSFAPLATANTTTLWLAANDDSLNDSTALWQDRSLAGRDAQAIGNPFRIADWYNSRPAVDFSGGAHYSLAPEALHPEFTYFAVIQNDNTNASTTSRGYIYTNQEDGVTGNFTYQKRQGFHFSGSQSMDFQYWLGTTNATATLSEPNNTQLLFEMQGGSSGSEGFLNNISEVVLTDVPGTNRTPNEAFIGARNDAQGTDFLDGKVAELIVRAENDPTTNDAVRTYLNHKYRLLDVQNLPQTTAIGNESQLPGTQTVPVYSTRALLSPDGTTIQTRVPFSVLAGVNGIGDGLVDVTVTNPDGSSVTAAQAFEYRLPQLTSITPTAGPDSGGNDVAVEGEFLSRPFYGQSFAVTNSSGSAIADYETILSLDTASLIAEEILDGKCVQIRVYDAADNPVDHYLDGVCGTAHTPLWIKVPNLPVGVSTYRVVYDSTAMSSFSNLANFSFAPLLQDAALYQHFAAPDLDVPLDTDVSQWRSRNGDAAIQTSVTEQPNLELSPHQTLPTVYFDGGDSLDFAWPGIANTNYSLAASVFRDDVRTTQMVLGSSTNSNGATTYLGYQNDTVSEFRRFSQSSAQAIIPGFSGRENHRLVGTLEAGVAVKTFFNAAEGAGVGTQAFTMSVPAAARIGENVNGSKFYGGINEVMVFTKALNQSEVNVLDAYLANKYTAGTEVSLGEVQSQSLTIDGASLENFEFVDAQTITGRAPANTGSDKDVVYTGVSGNTATLSAAYDYGTNLVPNAITDLSLEELASGVFRLNWSAPNENGSPLTDYVIEYALDSNFNNLQVYPDPTSLETSLLITDLDQFTTRYFRVRAVNGVGQSLPSNVVENSADVCTQDYNGADLIISQNTTLGGIHCNIGLFRIDAGVELSVSEEEKFEVYAQNIDIQGVLNAEGSGFQPDPGQNVEGRGPGAGERANDTNVRAGGSYGGKSGAPLWTIPGIPGPVYGLLEYPNEMGSSGGNANNSNATARLGGAGGGSVKMVASNSTAITGTVSANSGQVFSTIGTGNNTGGGGGSGGSVWIQTDTFSGDGLITANGGNPGYYSAPGGGGRIAVYAQTDTYTGDITARGADTEVSAGSRSQTAGAGTIYRQVNGAATLSIDNLDAVQNPYNNENSKGVGQTLVGTSVTTVDEFDLTVAGLAGVSLEGSLALTNSSLFIPELSKIQIGESVSLANTPDLDITGALVLSGTTPHVFNNIIIQNEGSLTHSNNSQTEEHKLDLVANSLVVQEGGDIDVSERGYSAAPKINGGQGFGPGGGNNGQYRASGGGYGGRGGDGQFGEIGGLEYGSKNFPNSLGSGGGSAWQNSGVGGAGGGSLKLTITEDFVLDGTLRADGQGGDNYGGGGSGGSIWIEARNISGVGSISANGGNGNTNIASDVTGAGGGGRIALYYQDRDISVVEAILGSRDFANASDGTIYENQIPESGLASATFASNPNPVSVNAAFDLPIANILNIYGNPIRDGYVDKVECDVTVTGDNGNYTETVTGGFVADGICNLPSTFATPTVTGQYVADLTVRGSDINTTTETTSFTFDVAAQASNLAAAQATPNETKPQYATLTSPARSFVSHSLENNLFTITSTGYVDSGNGELLNGTPCVFRITGPNSFDQSFTTPNLVGGSCSYAFAPNELPFINGTYTVESQVQGDGATLVTDPITFEREFDIYQTVGGQIVGSPAADNDPLIGDQVNTLTSPVLYRYDSTTLLLEGLACELEYTDNAGLETIAGTVNDQGLCTAEVPANTLTGTSVDVQAAVLFDLTAAPANTFIEFKTAPVTLNLVGSPSDLAKEDTGNPGAPVFGTQTVSPTPAFLNGNVTLQVNGLLDSITDGALENTTCEFVVTNPNNTVQVFSSTSAAGGTCTVALSPSDLQDGGVDVPGNYGYQLRIAGDSGNLLTPSVTFERTYDINLINGTQTFAGATTSIPAPAVVGQGFDLRSPRMYRYNGSNVIQNGLPCENELVIGGITEVVPGTTASGYCRTTMTPVATPGTGTVTSRVTLSGVTFENGASPIEVKPLNTAQICGLVFQDDLLDQSYDGGETLLANQTLTLRRGDGSVVATQPSADTGYACFGSLFDGTYILEVASPGGTQTVPGGNGTYSIILGPGSVQNREFGFNGNAPINIYPIFNDVNEDGTFNAGELSLVDQVNTLPVRLFAAGDLNTVLETVNADGTLQFGDQFPGDYVVEMDIPNGMSPTGTGFTVDGNVVRKDVTVGFGVAGATNFAFSFDPSGLAQADPNNPTQPRNTGTIVNSADPVYVDYNFDAVTTGLFDTGNNRPLDNVACSMTFSGPGFATPLTKSGTVTNGTCYVDPVPTAPGPHQVTTTVVGPSGNLTTIATTFDVVPNLIDICPLPFRDYDGNATRTSNQSNGANEPYLDGLTVELYDNEAAATVGTLTSNDQGTNCFADVEAAPSDDYQVIVTPLAGTNETTSTGLSVQVDPLPSQDVTLEFGFNGNLSFCAANAYMDNDANEIQDANEPGIGGYNWQVRDEYNHTVANISTDGTGRGCVSNLIPELYRGALNSVGQVDLTGVQTDERIVTLAVGGGNGATSEEYVESFGYANEAAICPNPTFADYNGNGNRDTGEDLVGNLTTRLYQGADNTGTLVQTITTNGTRCFDPVVTQTDVGQVTYTLEQDPPIGGTLTSTAETYTFTQGFGVPLAKRFGYRGNATICPFPTFQDLNTNGTFESEPFLDGVSTTLRDLDGTVVATLTTNNAIPNCFENLLGGSYNLSQDKPTNTISTTGGQVQNVTVSAGGTENVAFGYDGRPLVCPVVYSDDNANGVQDGNEPRLSVVGLELRDSSNNLLETITSQLGENCFDTTGTAVGEVYSVTALGRPNYALTTGSAILMSNALSFAEKYEPKFGYNGNGQICAQYVFEDFNNNGSYDLAFDTLFPDGTELVLTTEQGSTNYPNITTVNGGGCFSNVAPGQYTLNVLGDDIPPGSVSTTGGAQFVVLGAGQTQQFSFGYTGDATLCPQQTFEDLDFNVDYDPQSETLLSQITVNLYRAADLNTVYKTLTLDGSGTKCFTGLFGGDYRIEQVGLDSYFTGGVNYWSTTEAVRDPGNSNNFYVDVTLVSQDYKLMPFGYTQNTDFQLGAVFGFLYVDRAENGVYEIAGTDNFELTVFDNDVPVVDQTVKLFKLNTTTGLYEEVDATTTDAEGRYGFRRLPVGDYEVRVPNNSLVGLRAVSPNPSVHALTIAQDPVSALNDKVSGLESSFQFTARICPFFYIDLNADGDYDAGSVCLPSSPFFLHGKQHTVHARTTRKHKTVDSTP